MRQGGREVSAKSPGAWVLASFRSSARTCWRCRASGNSCAPKVVAAQLRRPLNQSPLRPPLPPELDLLCGFAGGVGRRAATTRQSESTGPILLSRGWVRRHHLPPCRRESSCSTLHVALDSVAPAVY